MSMMEKAPTMKSSYSLKVLLIKLLTSLFFLVTTCQCWIQPSITTRINREQVIRKYEITKRSGSTTSNNPPPDEKKRRPQVIIFDLDGCLWSPEMYELVYFSGGRGAPFTPDPTNPQNLRTIGGELVYLLGDVRAIFSKLHGEEEYQDIQVGISSRTDRPDWARELLSKFTFDVSEQDNDKESSSFTLEKVFQGGPIEIAKDSKVQHFHRICRSCNVQMEDILFFDNELGNCRKVAELGVTVAYCPSGVTEDIWNIALNEAFPQVDGKVVGMDAYV